MWGFLWFLYHLEWMFIPLSETYTADILVGLKLWGTAPIITGDIIP
jgi:hypothetical protein